MTTSPSPVFLDANVLLYAGGAPHLYKEPSILALRRIAEGALPAVTSAEVLQEILHRFLRVGQPERGMEMVDETVALVDEVLPVGAEDVQRAARLGLEYRGLPSRDLIHLAVMQRHELGAILSSDGHFDAVTGITRIDPRDL